MDKVNAAPDLPDDNAREDATAAAVLSDDGNAPGGGGLRPEGTTPPRATGGAAPNAPIDPGVSADDAAAERDSIAEAAARAPEPRPASQ